MATNNPFEYIEEIYKEHYTYLRKILIGLTRNEEIADDIIQEVFAKILVNPSIILEVTYMKSWLVKIARNTLLDYYKKKKPGLLKEERMEDLFIHHHTPEAKFLVNSELAEALNKLSKLDRTIILAKVHYGYDYQEISDLLDIPVSTLKSKVFRIRKQMVKER